MAGATVTAASAHDRPRVIDTVVEAFRDDPALRYFFPDDVTYDEHAASFAGQLFDRRIAYGTVWVAEEGSAVAMWEPPAGELPHGSPPALALEPAALGRMAAYDEAVHDLLPAQPFWYLGILATHPDAAGRRLGRAVMAAGVERAARARLPCYLETTTERNVGIYRRAGWDVRGAVPVDGFTVRVMGLVTTRSRA